PSFEQAFEAAQSQLRTGLSQYEEDYGAILECVVSTFAQLAADSERRMQATGQPVAIDFEETVVREVLAALPEPDLLWRSLSLRYRIGVLHLGSEFLTEQRRAAQERRMIEAIAADSRVAREHELPEQRLVREELF